MWLFDRRLVLAGLLATAGCGFTPVYDGEDNLRGQIAFATPQNSNDYSLRNALEDRLGAPTATAPYKLSVSLDISEDNLAITTDQITTRFNVVAKANYALRNQVDDSVVVSGTVDNFTSYSATGTTVATQAAQRDAYNRLMKILADQITTRLFATVP